MCSAGIFHVRPPSARLPLDCSSFRSCHCSRSRGPAQHLSSLRYHRNVLCRSTCSILGSLLAGYFHRQIRPYRAACRVGRTNESASKMSSSLRRWQTGEAFCRRVLRTERRVKSFESKCGACEMCTAWSWTLGQRSAEKETMVDWCERIRAPWIANNFADSLPASALCASIAIEFERIELASTSRTRFGCTRFRDATVCRATACRRTEARQRRQSRTEHRSADNGSDHTRATATVAGRRWRRDCQTAPGAVDRCTVVRATSVEWSDVAFCEHDRVDVCWSRDRHATIDACIRSCRTAADAFASIDTTNKAGAVDCATRWSRRTRDPTGSAWSSATTSSFQVLHRRHFRQSNRAVFAVRIAKRPATMRLRQKWCTIDSIVDSKFDCNNGRCTFWADCEGESIAVPVLIATRTTKVTNKATIESEGRATKDHHSINLD